MKTRKVPASRKSETRKPAVSPPDLAFKSLRLETFADPLEAGLLLLQAKERLGHGNFLNWLAEHFPISAKSANRLMSVAQMFKRLNPDSETKALLLQLESSALYELAAKSTTAKIEREVIKRLRAGEHLRYRDIRRLKGKGLRTASSAEALTQRLIGQIEAFHGWCGVYHEQLEPALSRMDGESRKALISHLSQLKETTKRLEQALTDS